MPSDPVERSEGWAARLMAEIRRRDPDLAAAMDAEDEGRSSLTAEQGARLDAWMYGQGYLINGRRVAPKSVVVVRAPGAGDGDQEYEVDDDEMKALLRELARAIDSCTPADLGFCLLLFRFDESGTFYISNAERGTMLKALQEFVRVQKGRGH